MKVVYENSKAKVIKFGESYEVYRISTRDYDGIKETGWNLSCEYGKWYCRDWLGRICEYKTEHNPLEDALRDAKS